jgi:hypothetical protein
MKGKMIVGGILVALASAGGITTVMMDQDPFLELIKPDGGIVLYPKSFIPRTIIESSMHGSQLTGPTGFLEVTADPWDIVSDWQEVVFNTGDGDPDPKITKPVSGDLVSVGSLFFIAWDSDGSGLISIVLHKGAQTRLIAAGILDTGVYEWAVDSDLPNGTDYRIEIQFETGSVFSDTFEVTR